MIFLKEFSLPSKDSEQLFFENQRMTCYNNNYPFQIFPDKVSKPFTFDPLTIFYGSNGSGKTTLLNVMADALGAGRKAPYNRSAFFESYISICNFNAVVPRRCSFIASDDVFNRLLTLRDYNQKIDAEREALQNEHRKINDSNFHFTMRSLSDCDELKKVNDAHKKTLSSFVNDKVAKNIKGHSNGESAFDFFVNELTDNGLYFLDEPENSLSAERQNELCDYIENCTRFFNCQIVMATHSPFMLAAKGAKIYDLDKNPISVSDWTKLENVRAYYDFFQAHSDEF